MYEKIIRGKLHFPSHLSPEARSVLAAVLPAGLCLQLTSFDLSCSCWSEARRTVCARVGAAFLAAANLLLIAEDGIKELRSHPFFAPLDFVRSIAHDTI